MDIAVEQEIIKKSGAWYSYGEDRIGQGRENAKAYLREYPEKTNEIEQKIRRALNMTDDKENTGTTAPAKESK